MNAQQSHTEPDLIRDVVRDLAEEFAPDETPILDSLAESSDAQALRRLRRHGKRKERLGFGIGDLLPVLTPVLWIALTKAIELTVEGGMKALWDRLTGKPRERVPSLSDDEIASVCDKVRDALLDKGFERDRVETIVEALRERLRRNQDGGANEVGR
jgi:hypothetical protein